jgi:hypothetical protein
MGFRTLAVEWHFADHCPPRNWLSGAAGVLWIVQQPPLIMIAAISLTVRPH